MSLVLKEVQKRQSTQDFDELHQLYGAKVYAMALRMTADSEAALDITQDTFLALHIKMNDIKHDNLGAWIIRAAKYYTFHYITDRNYQRRHEIPMDAEDELASPVSGGTLKDFLDCLPAWMKDEDRRILVLRYYEGYSLREISIKLGYTYTGLRSHVSRLFAQIRARGFGDI